MKVENNLPKLGASPLPFPKHFWLPLPYFRSFTVDGLKKLKLGIEPQSMDNHWSSDFTNSSFIWFRSWSGLPIFKPSLEQPPKEHGLKSFG